MQAKAEKQNLQEKNKRELSSAADRLSVIYYTDPLCCWSWAFEETWQQFTKEYAEILSWRYCMSGMLPDWKSYHDQLNAVSKPLQMGPVWMQVRQQAHVTINDRIWFDDPPASSYPACVAVKCAARQSSVAEHYYLHQLREAVMVKGKNIARKEILLEIAREASLAAPNVLDASLFEKELTHPEVIDAFKKDLQEVSLRNINRFPSLLITSPDKKGGLLLTGNRPYTALCNSIEQFLQS